MDGLDEGFYRRRDPLLANALQDKSESMLFFESHVSLCISRTSYATQPKSCAENYSAILDVGNGLVG